MVSVRQVLIGLALAFTAYLAARGLLWTKPIDYPLLIVAVLGLYLATTWLCIFLEPGTLPGDAPEPRSVPPGVRRGPTLLPVWACVLALSTAFVVPSSIALAVGEAARLDPFATWYIGGIGALMTIVMVRRRPWIAWTGIVLLAVGCAVWMGPLTALGLGLVGSIVWVAAAQMLVLSMDRAAADTVRLAELQQAASAWQASQSGRQRERRVQVQRALGVAGPVLAEVVRTGGELDAAGRVEARLAEGRLRDELRGPRLLDDEVRDALEAARRGGALVTVLDEGGLDGVDEASLTVIRAELAETVRGARSRRLYIRTAPHDRIAVTVVGRAADALSDDDSVDLWREIPYPTTDAAV